MRRIEEDERLAEAGALELNEVFRSRLRELEGAVLGLVRTLVSRAPGSTDPEVVRLGVRIQATKAAIAAMKGEENGDRQSRGE